MWFRRLLFGGLIAIGAFSLAVTASISLLLWDKIIDGPLLLHGFPRYADHAVPKAAWLGCFFLVLGAALVSIGVRGLLVCRKPTGR